jgi:hypothetical protein
MTDPDTTPVTTAGMISRCSQPSGSSLSGTYPPEGSQPSVPAKTRISTIAIQNSGTEMPIWLKTVATRSTTDRGRRAEIVPSGTAISSATRIEANARVSVAGSRSAISEVTVSPLRKLTPRSPVRARPSQPANCARSGWSSPDRSRRAS